MAKEHGNRYHPGVIEQQKQEALQMWFTGAKLSDIAKHLRIGKATAHRRIDAAIADMRPHADYDRYRAVQLAELEVVRRTLRRMITLWKPGQEVYSPLAAIDRLLRLQEREAKLLGLDKVPTAFDKLSALSPAETEALIREFADELADEAEDYANG